MFKKLIILLFVFSFMILLVSCESDSDNDDSKDESNIELYGSILRKNDSIIYQENGDIHQFVMSNLYYINITSDTKIVKQRESCSGFSDASVDDLEIGDIIAVYYFPDNISYRSEKTIVRPSLIEAYHENCIDGSVSSGSSSNCTENCWME